MLYMNVFHLVETQEAHQNQEWLWFYPLKKISSPGQKLLFNAKRYDMHLEVGAATD